jgi:hypothetical protein
VYARLYEMRPCLFLVVFSHSYNVFCLSAVVAILVYFGTHSRLRDTLGSRDKFKYVPIFQYLFTILQCVVHVILCIIPTSLKVNPR